MKWATAFIALTAVARFTGSDNSFTSDPGACAPGLMLSLAPRALLTPAPQAKARVNLDFVQALPRRSGSYGWMRGVEGLRPEMFFKRSHERQRHVLTPVTRCDLYTDR